MTDQRIPSSKSPQRLLRKAGSKVAGLIKRFEPTKLRPKRTRHTAQKLLPNENIFHDYKTPKSQIDANGSGKSGKKRYEWTPEQDQSLRRLVVHSDVKFDDISAAMRDESGDGPWYAIWA